MLTEIRLKWFKCFETLRLPLTALTLLTGQNASGKSTIVQALALLHQTAVDTNWHSSLPLDGSILSLGTLADVVDKVNGRLQFSIGLTGPEFDCGWTFGSTSSDREDIAVTVADICLRDGSSEVLLEAKNPPSLLPTHPSLARASLAKTIEGLNYISAERSGPRETYPLYDPIRHRTVGPTGDKAPGMIHWCKYDEIDAGLRFPAEPAAMLFKQILAWLADFFPGLQIDVQRVPRANQVTVGILTSSDTDYHRPQHVGFGITHVLPIIVACLHATKGDLIIIENPETHLHPMGQAKMGLFLARVAASGVQLIVETHSDHVLNGVRRGVKESVLNHNDVAIHFFQPRALAKKRKESQIVSPQIDSQGNIDYWPDGFFDQFDKDMGYFAGLE